MGASLTGADGPGETGLTVLHISCLAHVLRRGVVGLDYADRLLRIAGSFRGTSGSAEMLLHGCAGEIELLPAWPHGSAKGRRARAGFELDIQRKEGELVNVTVRWLAGGSCRLRYGAVTRDLNLAEGQSAQGDGIQ